MTRSGRILVLVSLASLAVGCFGEKRSPKPNGTALWIAAESSVPETGVLGRLSSQGIGEYFVEAARLRVEGRTVAVEPAPALRMTRRERTTLVVGGAWPLLDVDVEATARGLAEAVAGLRLEADRAGQLPVGVHFDLETGGTSESFAAVLSELRDLMDPDLYLSVSLSRRDLELEGLSERLEAVDFTVAFLYGQRPGEKEDSAAWDLLAVERAAGRLEEIGRPYYLAASILGLASWRGRGGETKAETTELDLASLVREDRLELKRGFTLEGIDRQVYEFRARGPVTVGSWKLAASDSVRVVRAATTNIEELLRRAQAWRGERRLGVLFWRLPSGTERLSMTASNVADALAPEPARPALDVLIERSESRRETWVLSVTLDNRNDEGTDLAFFDSNYVDLAVRGGRIADVDPGDFARFELSRDGERATMRALREADKVRLFAPLVEGKQKLVSGPIVFVRGEGAPAILSSGRFILTDGEMLDLELREWSFGGDR